MSKKTIVITGCSSGFGRVSALELAKRGWHVFATVRKEADQADLLTEAATLGCKENLTPLLCDITQTEQVAALAQAVKEQLPTNSLDALLNNAGTATGGPIELVSLDDMRALFEINIIAHVDVIQHFLPLLKEARGTIINVSSVSGRIATPVTGVYAASKFALEAISDALRVELAPFGVRVVLIEPSSSPTNIWQTSIQRALQQMEPHRNGPYGPLLHLAERSAARSSKQGFPPQLFADTLVRILDSRQPRPRYIVPRNAIIAVLMRRFLPDTLWDRLVRRTMKW
ncbi:MAG TPA: SDR family NAD(P)-dependent oxidoreductase [Ktedonobacteraceae bacterium]|nr:SDR family NAD(P)-dependent oxidoreductase [Ktedonobacteraceae bacterium]